MQTVDHAAEQDFFAGRWCCAYHELQHDADPSVGAVSEVLTALDTASIEIRSKDQRIAALESDNDYWQKEAGRMWSERDAALARVKELVSQIAQAYEALEGSMMNMDAKHEYVPESHAGTCELNPDLAPFEEHCGVCGELADYELHVSEEHPLS